MAQFFMKMIDWVANEIVVKHLANSRTFQRFALKTDETIQHHTTKATKMGEEVLKKASEHGEKIVKGAAEQPPPDISGFTRFFNAFADEIKKDVGKVTKV